MLFNKVSKKRVGLVRSCRVGVGLKLNPTPLNSLKSLTKKTISVECVGLINTVTSL